MGLWISSPVPLTTGPRRLHNLNYNLQILYFVRLINQEGSLLSYAGSGDKDAKVTAAIASSIWAAYEKNGKMAFHSDELKMIFMNCEVSI